MAHSTCGHTADGDEWTYTTPRVLPRVPTADLRLLDEDRLPLRPPSTGLSAAPEYRLRRVVAHCAPQPCCLATRTPQVAGHPPVGGCGDAARPCRTRRCARRARVTHRNGRVGGFGAPGAPRSAAVPGCR